MGASLKCQAVRRKKYLAFPQIKKLPSGSASNGGFCAAAWRSEVVAAAAPPVTFDATYALNVSISAEETLPGLHHEIAKKLGAHAFPSTSSYRARTRWYGSHSGHRNFVRTLPYPGSANGMESLRLVKDDSGFSAASDARACAAWNGARRTDWICVRWRPSKRRVLPCCRRLPCAVGLPAGS